MKIQVRTIKYFSTKPLSFVCYLIPEIGITSSGLYFSWLIWDLWIDFTAEEEE